MKQLIFTVIFSATTLFIGASSSAQEVCTNDCGGIICSSTTLSLNTKQLADLLAAESAARFFNDQTLDLHGFNSGGFGFEVSKCQFATPKHLDTRSVVSISLTIGCNIESLGKDSLIISYINRDFKSTSQTNSLVSIALSQELVGQIKAMGESTWLNTQVLPLIAQATSMSTNTMEVKSISFLQLGVEQNLEIPLRPETPTVKGQANTHVKECQK